MRSLPSAFRSCETYTWSAFLTGLGRVVLPERVDQPVGGDDLVRMQQQDRQERALLRAADIELATVLEHLQRTKNPEFHAVFAQRDPIPRRRV